MAAAYLHIYWPNLHIQSFENGFIGNSDPKNIGLDTSFIIMCQIVWKMINRLGFPVMTEAN